MKKTIAIVAVFALVAMMVAPSVDAMRDPVQRLGYPGPSHLIKISVPVEPPVQAPAEEKTYRRHKHICSLGEKFCYFGIKWNSVQQMKIDGQTYNLKHRGSFARDGFATIEVWRNGELLNTNKMNEETTELNVNGNNVAVSHVRFRWGEAQFKASLPKEVI